MTVSFFVILCVIVGSSIAASPAVLSFIWVILFSMRVVGGGQKGNCSVIALNLRNEGEELLSSSWECSGSASGTLWVSPLNSSDINDHYRKIKYNAELHRDDDL